MAERLAPSASPSQAQPPAVLTSIAVAGGKVRRSGHKAHRPVSRHRLLTRCQAAAWGHSPGLAGKRTPLPLPCCRSVHNSPGTPRDGEEAQPMGPASAHQSVESSESHQGLTWGPGN